MIPNRSRPYIQALLIDISGNLQIGSKTTPHAIEAVNQLRSASFPFRLCSNTSKESTDELISKLTKMGFNISSNREVWTSIGAVKQMLGDMGLKRPYMLLNDSARQEVTGSDEPDHVDGFDSVIVGLAPNQFDYVKLNKAFRILSGEENRLGYSSSGPMTTPLIPLIATHKAKYIETEDPPGRSLGPGPFVTALESATGTQAHVVGKPTKGFFELVIGDFSPEELDDEGATAQRRAEKQPTYPNIAVIGDDIEADLGKGAIELGLWRVLVRTGKYRPGDESNPGVVPPDEIVDDFASFVSTLLASQSRTK